MVEKLWSSWFLLILGTLVLIFGGALWFWVKSLIADTVEKNLNGFKEAVEQDGGNERSIRGIRKHNMHASVLEGFNYFSSDEQDHP